MVYQQGGNSFDCSLLLCVLFFGVLKSIWVNHIGSSMLIAKNNYTDPFQNLIFNLLPAILNFNLLPKTSSDRRKELFLCKAYANVSVMSP